MSLLSTSMYTDQTFFFDFYTSGTWNVLVVMVGWRKQTALKRTSLNFTVSSQIVVFVYALSESLAWLKRFFTLLLLHCLYKHRCWCMLVQNRYLFCSSVNFVYKPFVLICNVFIVCLCLSIFASSSSLILIESKNDQNAFWIHTT